MIRLDVAHGSVPWVMARIGIPTASQFSRIVTPTGKKSGAWDEYAHQLIAESILQSPVIDYSSGFMDRGSGMEEKAVGWYELNHDVDCIPGGFCLRDDRRAGCSPDRLVGETGLLEIKCPSAVKHVAYLLDTQGIGYRPQVQGELWVCNDREWIDTLSFNPDMPPALVRVYRDREFQAALDQYVPQFCDYVDELKLKLQPRGLFHGETFGRDLFATHKLTVVA